MRPTCLRFPYNCSSTESGCVSAHVNGSLGNNAYVISGLAPGISWVVNPFIGVGIGEFCGASISRHVSEAVKDVS